MTDLPNITSRLAALPTILLALLVAAPLFAVAAALLAPPDDAWRHLSQTVLDDYVVNSLLLMVLVAFIAGTLGITTAWLVATCRFPGRRWLSWLLVLPLAAPAYVVAYAYTDLLDVSGPVQSLFRDLFGLGIDEFAFRGVRTLPGIADIHTDKARG